MRKIVGLFERIICRDVWPMGFALTLSPWRG